MAEVWKDTVAGVVGGLVGTAFMQTGVKASQRLPETLQPPQMTEDPGNFMITRAEWLAKKPLSPDVHRTFARGLHWAYGTFWPTVVAATFPRRSFDGFGRTTLLGAALGAGVWAVGYLGWLPAANLIEQRSGKNPRRQGSALASHIVYGILSTLPLYLAHKLFPAPRWVRHTRSRALLSSLRSKLTCGTAGLSTGRRA